MKVNIWGKILPSNKDTPQKRNMKITILVCAGSMILMFIIAFLVFFASLKGPEEVLVPNAMVNDDGNRADLISAIKKLQEKGLFVKVNFKHSIEYQRGEVIAQRPNEGAIVKRGRHIVLYVSEGSVTSAVSDYRGKTLESVELELKSLFINLDDSAIRIKKPVIEVFDEAPAGTILEQIPDPGTSIKDGEIIYLQFKVSKGPKGRHFYVGDYSGLYLSYENQLDFYETILENKLSFTILVRDRTMNEGAGRIVDQEPEAGKEMPENSIVVLTMTRPENIPSEKKFGIYTAELDTYIIKLSISLKEKKADGKEEVIFSAMHYGGPLSLPYIIGSDSEAVLYVNGKEYTP